MCITSINLHKTAMKLTTQVISFKKYKTTDNNINEKWLGDMSSHM